MLAIPASRITPIAGLTLATILAASWTLFELPTIFVYASCLVGNHAHPGGFLCLVLPSAIVLGRDAGRAVSNNLLGGHQIILVDEIAYVGPAEIVPAEVLQASLQPAFFQDLDQCIGCQVSIFS